MRDRRGTRLLLNEQRGGRLRAGGRRRVAVSQLAGSLRVPKPEVVRFS